MRTELGALTLAGLALVGCREAGYDGPYKTIVLVSLDTLRADHLGCYGGAVETPSLDALAAEGVRFADVTTAAPTTLASHVSIMTGTYVHTHGTPRNGFEVLPENRMLAEVLQEQGFETAAFLGSWALDESFGFGQGFDHFDQEFDIKATVAKVDGQVDLAVEQDQRRAERVNEALFHYLDTTEAERRFLFLHYFDAHAPYDAPPPFGREKDGEPQGSTLVDLKKAVLEHQGQLIENPPGFDGVIVGGIPTEILDRADGSELPIDRVLKDDYAREVRYLDHHLGRLFDGLRERGQLEQALVIVTADHGESFHEHGDFWNHGSWVYDTTVRVPLIVWHSPTLRADEEPGRAVHEPVSTIDIMPTILGALGIPSHDRSEGLDLGPALAGEPFERGPVYSEATQPKNKELELGGWANARKARCIRSGTQKLIVSPLHQRLELFDLAQDPGERRNLSSNDTTGLQVFEQLQAWSLEARPSAATFNPDQDTELIRRINAYGY